MTRYSPDPASGFLDGDPSVLSLDRLPLDASLSSTSFESLVHAAASEFTARPLRTKSKEKTVPRPCDQAQLAAMCAILATIARDGSARTPVALRHQLDALGVQDESHQTTLAPILAPVVPRLERVLDTTCTTHGVYTIRVTSSATDSYFFLVDFDFAHVVDVSWRLDYVLRSSGTGSVNEAVYFVHLELQSPRATIDSLELETLTFMCSVEELRELVYRIQEAVNEVDKLVAGRPSHLPTHPGDSIGWIGHLLE
ncbi:hypothetical protein PsorP6_014911 [Peronosclerospora sorghi]|uniref:Uncharacterized protein n=1 Tax=Peronosclerospora sorghi TaxID=230839 RepID=A0ACC0VTN5_9STRA|nr:hypothetical protein PsorP6_014911 [Peronosclerospora sorghi]